MSQGAASREGADTESSAQERQQVLGQGRGENAVVPFLGRGPSFGGRRRLRQTSGQPAGALDSGARFFSARRCHRGRLGRGGSCEDFFIWKTRRGNLSSTDGKKTPVPREGEKKYCVVLPLPSWSYQVLSGPAEPKLTEPLPLLLFTHTHTHAVRRGDKVVKHDRS